MTKPQTERGFVSLVGAGPGDPDLLTRKAADRLTDADLVLYDALVDPATLALAPTAQRVYVGKRAGRPQVRQEFIHWLMIRAARAGKKVVRLKGGDPFVFGRGGEEGLALAAAGISFEVVPGVSSAIAAAALAGIPVTHRGLSSGFVVVSGHAEDAYRAGAREPRAAQRDRGRDDGPGPHRPYRRAPHRARLERDDAGGGHIWSVHVVVGRVDDVPARPPAAAPAARARREVAARERAGVGRLRQGYGELRRSFAKARPREH